MSLQYNVIKAQCTSADENFPAYDMLLDFNQGISYDIFNDTQECWASDISNDFSVAEYVNDLADHSEQVRQIGLDIILFKINGIFSYDFSDTTYLYSRYIIDSGATDYSYQSILDGEVLSGRILSSISDREVNPEIDFLYEECQDSKVKHTNKAVSFRGFISAVESLSQKLTVLQEIKTSE